MIIFAIRIIAGMSLPGRFPSYFVKALTGLIVLVIAVSCATIVTPSGGDKDITPPELTYSIPQNHTTKFNNDRIVLGFNEYVQLKDIQKFLLVSPPLNKDPEFRIKKKSLIIKLEDTLRSNTTYNFYFGEAIVDLTESNPLTNFSFSLSTGEFIDSLSIKGRLTDAYTRLPIKESLVMLYSNLADSAPKLERPVYVSRCNDAGVFEMNSLASGKYRLVALKDENNDYLYNLPNEQVAFYDSLVEPYYLQPPLQTDTLQLQAPAEQPVFDLYMFTEPDSIQRVSKALMTSPHQLSMYFRYPLVQPEFNVLNLDSTRQWSIKEFSQNRDTLTCWLLGEMPDSLRIKVSDLGKVIDTLELSSTFKPRTEKGKTVPVDSTLRFTTSAGKSKKLGWNIPYLLTFNNPLSEINDSLPLLIRTEGKDTLRPRLYYADSLHRKVKVDFPWMTLEEYTLLFPQGTFKDIYGETNDTVKTLFRLIPKDEYGLFKVKMELVNQYSPVIIQLLNEKSVVLRQEEISESQEIDFGFLSPGKYVLKAIFDENRNGKWDTGEFLKHRQPERTAINPKTIEVRGNWELEEEWRL